MVYHKILGFPVLYSRPLVFIHAICNSSHLLIPDSWSIPHLSTFTHLSLTPLTQIQCHFPYDHFLFLWYAPSVLVTGFLFRLPVFVKCHVGLVWETRRRYNDTLCCQRKVVIIVVQALSRVRLDDPADCSTLGFPGLHHLLEFAQTHVHWVSVGHWVTPQGPVTNRLWKKWHRKGGSDSSFWCLTTDIF